MNFYRINLKRGKLYFFLFALILLLLLANTAKADTIFIANLDGAQEVPANNSTGMGVGIVSLNEAETQIIVAVKFSGLGSNNTVGHIHGAGAVGQNAPVLFSLSFGNPPGSGNESLNLTQSVTPQQVQQLRNGLWYFNIHSAKLPNGEIRGQILPYSPFVARLGGAQAVPVTNSKGTGIARICLNKAENQMVLSFEYSNLSSSPADVSINGSAMPGVNSGIQINLFAGQSSFRFLSHSFWDITPQQVALLKAGQLYLRVGNAANPNGEIRGQIKPLNKIADFDGDSRADIGVIRRDAIPVTWWWLNSINNQLKVVQLGNGEEEYVPADYDGDGLTDIAIWNFTGSPAVFNVLLSANNTIVSQSWGLGVSDVPVAADYDGDGKADFAVYRKGLGAVPGRFWILRSLNKQLEVIEWGQANDVPITADFNGDRVSDLTVFREVGQRQFYSILSSTGEVKIVNWGQGTFHKPFIGDFDGDGKSDYGSFVVNGVAGTTPGDWWIFGSAWGVSVFHWGLGDDKPVPADYDGDGKHDFAIYRAGIWWIRQSSDGAVRIVSFGISTDIPVTGL